MRDALATKQADRWSSWRRHIRRFARDKRGIAATEFAMVLPIMVIMFLGTIEFSQALSVDRRVAIAAASAADMFAAQARVDNTNPGGGLITTTTDAAGLFRLSDRLLAPYDAVPLTVEVLSVRARSTTSGTTYVVDWSRDNKGGTPFPRGHSFTAASIATFMEKASMPVGLLTRPNTDTVVIAKATYNYSPIIVSYFMPASYRMIETVLKKPREFDCVILQPKTSCSLPWVDP